MRVELDLNAEGIEFTSEHNTGNGRWIKTDRGYVQVLVLAVDDSPFDSDSKQWVEVAIRVKNPKELT